jgi:ketosteroid isomerase-like protein
VSEVDAQLVGRIYDLIDDVAALTRDEAEADRVELELAKILSPDVAAVLNGPAYSNIREERWGIDGYRRLWTDWVKPFHSYRIEVEQLIDLGETVLALTVGRAQVDADSRVISNRGGTIWTVRDGMVTRVESFIDRADAEQVAYGHT